MTGSVICWIVLGVVAGMVSRRIIGGQGYGMLVDILLGILGAAFGGWTAKTFPTSILTALFGAIALIWLSTRPARDRSQRDRDQKLSQ
jgi:uncharacterized membrane protein YeaQ/YmgE (transglycosylase-associated protein family)